MSYSIDLRQKVLVALESKPSSEVVAEQFGVSRSFVRKLRARVRLTGDPAPLSPPGKARIVDPKICNSLIPSNVKRPNVSRFRSAHKLPRLPALLGYGIAHHFSMQNTLRDGPALSVRSRSCLHTRTHVLNPVPPARILFG
jgi:hypothetical protein